MFHIACVGPNSWHLVQHIYNWYFSLNLVAKLVLQTAKWPVNVFSTVINGLYSMDLSSLRFYVVQNCHVWEICVIKYHFLNGTQINGHIIVSGVIFIVLQTCFWRNLWIVYTKVKSILTISPAVFVTAGWFVRSKDSEIITLPSTVKAGHCDWKCVWFTYCEWCNCLLKWFYLHNRTWLRGKKTYACCQTNILQTCIYPPESCVCSLTLIVKCLQFILFMPPFWL